MKTPQFNTDWNYSVSRISGWTRKHWDEAFRMQMAAITESASPAGARQRLPGPRSHHGQDADELEGFTRSFIMAGPWLQTSKDGCFEWKGKKIDVAAFYRKGLLAGTNPNHPEYWGDMYDYAQHLVESASLAWALYLARDHLWNLMSDSEKSQIASWLNQCNSVACHQNNWLLFNLVTNAVLKKLDMPYSRKKLDENLRAVDPMYMGNGWYRDGNVNRIDYYNAWGFLYYYLIWAHLDGDSEPEICHMHFQRTRKFVAQMPYFIAADGGIPCFGRSMIYRFGFLAPLALGRSMRIFRKEDISDGLLRSVSGSVMHFFFSQPILTDSGHLSMGYLRPNNAMLEHYSCGGSPYWSSKAFHMLMLKEDDPFWNTEEEELPVSKGDFMKPLDDAGLQLVGQSKTGHVWLVNHKSWHNNPDYNSKYTHFAYSSVFGYESGKIHGSYNCDNALQWSTDDINWSQRWTMEHLENEPGFASSRYAMHNTDEKTLVWTGQIIRPWGYITVHSITVNRPFSFREGGFPLGWDDGDAEVIKDESLYYCRKDNLVSAIQRLTGWDGPGGNPAFGDDISGSNGRYRQSLVPGLHMKSGTGHMILAAVVYAGIQGESAETIRNIAGDVTLEDRLFTVLLPGDERATIHVNPPPA